MESGEVLSELGIITVGITGCRGGAVEVKLDISYPKG